MTLDGKKLQALSLLSSGMKNAQVARQLGLNEKTIRRWFKDDEFKNTLKDTKNEIVATIKADISADICTDMRKKRNEYFERVEQYREECEEIGTGLVKLGRMALEVALKVMSQLDPDEITSIQQLEKVVRVINGVAGLGMEIKAQALGIQPLVDALKQVTVNDEVQSI